MEEPGKMSNTVNPKKDIEEDGDDVPLPGFRFHPTDEELVGFYLHRKVEKKPISIELIKQVDIYKYDPWDLPKASNVGDKEWYFFCKRGRKYRNSIRPNRVTGSGFWKATGIDRPIYSSGGSGSGRECIGLKKSLVYYRGSAGKGTKTDWMMHEFRLPADHDDKSTKHIDVKSIAQEAEVWTLCRILKRGTSYRKCLPDWRELSAAAAHANNNKRTPADASSKTCSVESTPYNITGNIYEGYIDFRTPLVTRQNQDSQQKQFAMSTIYGSGEKNQTVSSLTRHPVQHDTSSTTSASYPNGFAPEMNELIKYGDWDELRSLVEFACEPFVM